MIHLRRAWALANMVGIVLAVATWWVVPNPPPTWHRRLTGVVLVSAFAYWLSVRNETERDRT